MSQGKHEDTNGGGKNLLKTCQHHFTTLTFRVASLGLLIEIMTCLEGRGGMQTYESNAFIKNAVAFKRLYLRE